MIRRLTILSLFSLVTAAIPCLAQGAVSSTSVIVNETGSIVTPLTTNWRFRFVGSDSATQYATASLQKAGEVVTLPHVFPSDKPGEHPPLGYGWYIRDINLAHLPENMNVSLDFAGLCLRSDVFVNGVRAGGSRYAYLPFTIDISQYRKAGAAVRIAVRVDSRLMPNQIPDLEAKGWWIYGGIGREVSLVTRPPQRIDGVQIRTLYRHDAVFDLHCTITPTSGTRYDSVVVAVMPQGGVGRATAYTFTGESALIRIGNIHAWTPEDPFRYELRFTPYFSGKKGASRAYLRGFCQLTTSGPQLLLNGKPYYLRGMARHDNVRLDGTPPTRQERLSDLSDMKSLGINFLRIAHFPQHHDVYELCDSIGLLVMDEMPAWKTDPKFLGSKEGWEYGSAYMRAIIAAHGNYTSVAIWSIGNQFKSYKTTVADFVGAVAANVKQADPSRLVTFCSYYYMWDKAIKSLDIIAVNEYFGWEFASLDMVAPMLDKIHKEWPDKPLVITEFGAQAQRGVRNSDAKLAGPIKSMIGKDISEDHHALFIAAHMDTIWSRRQFVSGMVVWSYNDYMANLNKKRAPDAPEGLNACGVVNDKRERKLAYDVVRKRFAAWRDAAGIKWLETIYEK